VPEDDEGIDLPIFDRKLQEFEKQDKEKRDHKVMHPADIVYNECELTSALNTFEAL
jgi:hypothetical protein